MTDVIHLHDFAPRSRANGPGERAVLWVQGCPRQCLGCWNPDSLAFDRRNPTSVEEMAARILAQPNLAGVTFSGGEPFAQAEALAELARTLRARRSEFTVVVFTGYRLEKLRAGAARGNAAWAALLEETDLLIDGPYVERLGTRELPLRGSSNQRLHFLSGRIRSEEVESPIAEFALGFDGVIRQTGFPDLPEAHDVFAALKEVCDAPAS